MHQHLDEIVAFVSFHALLAYLVIFLAAWLEAVPIVGSVIPGSTVILALSALVPSGSLKIAPVIAAAVIGAAFGDGLAYWIGHWQKRGVLSLWPLSKYPALIAESETFFHRRGTFAVFFARFVPPIRAFVPITAGALGMPPLRFLGVSWLAVMVWAPAMILPGVLAAPQPKNGARGQSIMRYRWLQACLLSEAASGTGGKHASRRPALQARRTRPAPPSSDNYTL